MVRCLKTANRKNSLKRFCRIKRRQSLGPVNLFGRRRLLSTGNATTAPEVPMRHRYGSAIWFTLHCRRSMLRSLLMRSPRCHSNLPSIRGSRFTRGGRDRFELGVQDQRRRAIPFTANLPTDTSSVSPKCHKLRFTWAWSVKPRWVQT